MAASSSILVYGGAGALGRAAVQNFIKNSFVRAVGGFAAPRARLRG